MVPQSPRRLRRKRSVCHQALERVEDEKFQGDDYEELVRVRRRIENLLRPKNNKY